VRNPDPQLAAAGIDTSRLDTDGNNLGPRLGVAWAPAGKKFVVRGGFGVFYGRTPSIMLGTAHSNNGINIIALTFTGDAVPTWPNNFSSIPAGGTAAKPTIFYIQPDFQNARLMQGNLAAEWEILPDTSLTVTYLSVSGSNLPRSIDRNLGSLSSRNFTGCRHRRGDSVSLLLSGRSAVLQLRPRHRLRVLGRIPLQRRDVRAEPPIRAPHAWPPCLHDRQGDRHRARRHRRRSQQRRR
jgi:hypothetical protein